MPSLWHAGLAAGLVALLSGLGPAGAAPGQVVVLQPQGPVPPGTVLFSGLYQGGGGAVENRIVYAVDVSGSTSSGGSDCNADGTIDQRDDFNGDGSAGSTLDCEIAGVVALNSSLRAQPVPVSLLAFASRTAIADMSPEAADAEAASSVADENGDRVPDLQEVAASLDEGSLTRFTPRPSVGSGTQFGPPLATLRALIGRRSATAAGTRVQYTTYFLSDGMASYPDPEVQELAALASRSADLLPVTVNTVAVGASGAGCDASSPLSRIASALGGTCTAAPPSGLQATLGGAKPLGLNRIDVTFAGSTRAASIDPVGRWTASFDSVAPSTTDYPYVARAIRDDGTTSEVTGTVAVRSAGVRYVALGDSYSSGNGLVPYFTAAEDPNGKLCQRSNKASAYSVRLPGRGVPVHNDPAASLTLRACGGAQSVELVGASHLAGVPPQLISADATADLVTLTIGGNDVFFSDVLKFCGANVGSNQDCQDSPYKRLNSGRTLTLDQFTRLRTTLVQIDLLDALRKLRAQAPNATVLVADYPHLIAQDAPGACEEENVFSGGERRWVRAGGDTLSATIERVAGQAGVFFTSVIDEFAAHEKCGGGQDWMYGFEASVKERGDDDEACDVAEKKIGPVTVHQTYCIYGRSFHPRVEGAKAYGDAFSAYLASLANAPPNGTARSGLPRNPAPTLQANRLGSPILIDGPLAAQASADPGADLLATLTPAEVAEVRGLTSDPASLSDLADAAGLASVPECGNQLRARPGQLLVLMGHGFTPGTAVTPRVTLADRELTLADIAVDSQGLAGVPVLLPADLGGTPMVAFDLRGAGTNGFERRVGSLLFSGSDDRACVDAERRAGYLSADGRALPKAANAEFDAGTVRLAGPPVPTTTSATTRTTSGVVATTTSWAAASSTAMVERSAAAAARATSISRTGENLAVWIAVSSELVAVGLLMCTWARRRQPGLR